MNRTVYKVVGRVWETTRGLQCPDLNGRGLLKSRERERERERQRQKRHTHTHIHVLTHTHEKSVKRAVKLRLWS